MRLLLRLIPLLFLVWFERLHTLLRDIELLPVSAPNDPAYKDQLIEAEKI